MKAYRVKDVAYRADERLDRAVAQSDQAIAATYRPIAAFDRAIFRSDWSVIRGRYPRRACAQARRVAVDLYASRKRRVVSAWRRFQTCVRA